MIKCFLDVILDTLVVASRQVIEVSNREQDRIIKLHEGAVIKVEKVELHSCNLMSP